MNTQDSRRVPKTGNKHYRRTEEEMIADLQKRIEVIKLRKNGRNLTKSPAWKSVSLSVTALRSAQKKATREEDKQLLCVINSALTAIDLAFKKNSIKPPRLLVRK